MRGVRAAEGNTLEVRDITLAFGGVTALSSVGFTVEPGTIHSLIGPNGAGKSSCLNVLSGVYTPSRGSLSWGEHQLIGMEPHKIARLGIARAFQNMVLSGSQTVAHNLLIGRHVRTRAGLVSSALGLPLARREDRESQRVVERVAELLGLDAYLDEQVGVLPYGVRKRIEIARALAMEPKLLLLDEPAAGLNNGETASLGRTLRDIGDDLGLSILLVEHDMSLVMTVSTNITVLNFGTVIADGVPSAVRSDPAVIRAYLGGQDGAIADVVEGLAT